MKTQIEAIARIKTDFSSKFGIPRQSGLVDELEATVIFEPKYRDEQMLKGIENFSHIWLLWQFSECADKKWTPTVRPPKLGGNRRMGVFATRSPFRPNSIGLSSVKLLGIEKTQNFGTVLHVSGADLLDGTPIFDIKPYIPYVDSHEDASNGFALAQKGGTLKVCFPDNLIKLLPENKRKAAVSVLSQDPRPGYQDDNERIYGIEFAGYNIRFKANDEVLTVISVNKLEKK